MKKEKLMILWTSDNKEIALDMILMYTLKSNQNDWWKECRLVTWGPSNQLLCKDPEVQALVKEIQAENVQVYACQRCAERYGLVDEVKALGINVQLMGQPLTQCLQDPEWSVLTI